MRLTKVIVFTACLLPALSLLAGALAWPGFDLGANPVEAILHSLGKWGLKFLLITLAVTPLRRWTGWQWLIAYRRMLGLFAFFYVLLHLATYVVLDQGLALQAIVEDVIERPYITIGMTAFVLLLPLAATSTRGMMRRLGRRWQSLHRLVYVIAVLGVWHFYWQVKLDTLEPLVYAVLLTGLLGVRLYWRWQKRRRSKMPSRSATVQEKSST